MIATLGPSSWSLARDLVVAGATALRVNSSHIGPDALLPILGQARKQDATIPIVVDLQGAKMRLGDLPEHRVRGGDTVVLYLASKSDPLEDSSRLDPVEPPPRIDAEAPAAKGRPTRQEAPWVAGDDRTVSMDPSGKAKSRINLPVPHPELFLAASKGDTITIGDGRSRLKVASVGRDHLEAHALCDGLLLPRKGINIVEHPIVLGELTESDAAFIEEAREFPGVFWAYSFMHDGREANWIRESMPGSLVAGKIERAESIDSLDSISSTVDSIWICRGDLGEQLGPSALARFVGALEPKKFETPILMAGQVLEHLTRHETPTRSEICHLHDLIERGYAGIVLSDETAIGVDPTNAVRSARDLIGAFLA